MAKIYTPRLSADYQSGEGDVRNLDDWLSQDPLMRADILKDWLHELEIAYNKAVEEFQAQMIAKGAMPDDCVKH